MLQQFIIIIFSIWYRQIKKSEGQIKTLNDDISTFKEKVESFNEKLKKNEDIFIGLKEKIDELSVSI